MNEIKTVDHAKGADGVPYRPELPPRPERIAKLPLHRGYPVPWFVPLIEGVPDHRIASAAKKTLAVRGRLCWTCGEKLETEIVFVLGPMCSISRSTAEPANHAECAEYAARACPFLTRPHAKRRDNDLPEDGPPMPGNPIMHNPGVMALWPTDGMKPFSDGKGGVLFQVNRPTGPVAWYREGRAATRSEVSAAFDKGFPVLLAQCDEAPDPASARADVEILRRYAVAYWPVR